MNYQFPHRRLLKQQAKRYMANPMSIRVSFLVVGLVMAVFALKYFLGAHLTYALANLAQYQDTATGIYFNEKGLSILFRMDLTQMVLAIPLSYAQITKFLVVSILAFLLIAPLRMGAMETYWTITRGGQPDPHGLTRWLKEFPRLYKALVVEFVVSVGVKFTGLLCTIPSLYLYYIFYSNVTTPEQLTNQMAMLQSMASFLALLAGVFCFWLHSCFLPVRYCLAAHPEYSLGQVFARGLRSTKGFRGRFFRFRLSMIPWFAGSQMTYNALDAYAMPYTSMASMLFVQECAKERSAKAETSALPE